MSGVFMIFAIALLGAIVCMLLLALVYLSTIQRITVECREYMRIQEFKSRPAKPSVEGEFMPSFIDKDGKSQ